MSKKLKPRYAKSSPTVEEIDTTKYPRNTTVVCIVIPQTNGSRRVRIAAKTVGGLVQAGIFVRMANRVFPKRNSTFESFVDFLQKNDQIGHERLIRGVF